MFAEEQIAGCYLKCTITINCRKFVNLRITGIEPKTWSLQSLVFFSLHQCTFHCQTLEMTRQWNGIKYFSRFPWTSNVLLALLCRLCKTAKPRSQWKNSSAKSSHIRTKFTERHILWQGRVHQMPRHTSNTKFLTSLIINSLSPLDPWNFRQKTTNKPHRQLNVFQ